MEHVRNEELLSFHELTEEEQEILRREVKNGNVEWFWSSRRKWYQHPMDMAHLYSSEIYRTISQEGQEMQHGENNEFPWHKVSSEWNALARDKATCSWYLFNSKPFKRSSTWYERVYVEFDDTVQNVIGVDMSKWMDIPWEDSLMLRPGYEQQDTVEPAVEDTISDEEASVVGYSSTEEYHAMPGEYPVVKLKYLHNLNEGDIVRLKKTGELVELVEYSETGCSGCKFFTYDSAQHPCRKCGFLNHAYVDYKPPKDVGGCQQVA